MQVQANLEKTPSGNTQGPSFIEMMNSKDATLKKMALETLPHIACTSFAVPGPYRITARSMEFPLDIPWTILVSAAGATVTSSAPNNQPGVSWTSQYSYLGFGVEGVPNLVVEGLNEEGLSVSAQSLVATVYPTVDPSQTSSALAVSDFIAWALGNFSTCAELAAALGSVVVWGNLIPGLGEEPLHFAVFDAQGYNGAIEFLLSKQSKDGEVVYQDNSIGVLTNDPPFEFHQYNLQLYNNRQSADPTPSIINGVTVPTQYSTGSYGTPGGYDAVSRFVKVAHLIRDAIPVTSNKDAKKRAWHILNTIDRVAGTTIKVVNNVNLYETTQWTVVIDHKKGTVDLRTYDNMNPKRLSLSDLLKGMTPGQQKVVTITSQMPPEYAPTLLTF